MPGQGEFNPGVHGDGAETSCVTPNILVTVSILSSDHSFETDHFAPTPARRALAPFNCYPRSGISITRVQWTCRLLESALQNDRTVVDLFGKCRLDKMRTGSVKRSSDYAILFVVIISIYVSADP